MVANQAIGKHDKLYIACQLPGSLPFIYLVINIIHYQINKPCKINQIISIMPIV